MNCSRVPMAQGQSLTLRLLAIHHRNLRVEDSSRWPAARKMRPKLRQLPRPSMKPTGTGSRRQRCCRSATKHCFTRSASTGLPSRTKTPTNCPRGRKAAVAQGSCTQKRLTLPGRDLLSVSSHWKFAVTVTSESRVCIVHCGPCAMAQSVQFMNVCPLLGAAVSTIGPLPTVKGRVQFDPEQTIFVGDTVTVPVFPGSMSMVKRALFPVAPVKHTTLTDIVPVTIAPDDDRPPALVFVLMEAETKPPPHAWPAAVREPVSVTAAI